MAIRHLAAGLIAGVIIASGSAVLAGHKSDASNKHGIGAAVSALAQAHVSASTSAASGLTVAGKAGHGQAKGKAKDQVKGKAKGELAGVLPGATRVEATLVSVGAGTLTFDANPAQLPSGLTVQTTGGEHVQAALPEASGAMVVTSNQKNDQKGKGGQASGTGNVPTLTAGEHVQLWILNGSVVAVLVPGNGH